MLRGDGADGVFGFVNTLIASATPLGVDPAALRFLNWSDVLPDMYGNTLFVTRETYRRSPELLQAIAASTQLFEMGLKGGKRKAPADPVAAICRMMETDFETEIGYLDRAVWSALFGASFTDQSSLSSAFVSDELMRVDQFRKLLHVLKEKGKIDSGADIDAAAEMLIHQHADMNSVLQGLRQPQRCIVRRRNHRAHVDGANVLNG